MSKPFIIFKVSWLTQRPGEEDYRDEIVDQFYYFINFLQDSGLVNHPMIDDKSDVTDDLELVSSDLTDEGLTLVKRSYDRWLQKVDNGMHPSDVSLLEKALAKIRSGN